LTIHSTQAFIAISGITSFSGAWLAKKLSDTGYRVLGLCSGSKFSYSGLKKYRLDLLSQCKNLELVENFLIPSKEALDWIKKQSITVWVHHHHHMANFRSPNYDNEAMKKTCMDPLADLVSALKESGVRLVVYSGSFFEPGEGGERPKESITPYSASKKQVWDLLQTTCNEMGILLSKVVIPDPIGALENNDRLIPILIKKSLKKEPIVVSTPLAQSDHLPIEYLVESYKSVIEKGLQGQALTVRPSGWQGTLIDWIEFVNKELLVNAFHLKGCEVQISASISQGVSYLNPTKEKVLIDWPENFKQYAKIVQSIGVNEVYEQ